MRHCRSDRRAWSNARMPAKTTVTGEARIIGAGFRQKVYAVVKKVPKEKVTTYGDVAGALGSRRIARQVGFALAALHDSSGGVPWQRVVNASGRISLRGDVTRGPAQRRALEHEGIRFDDTGRVIDFEKRRHKLAAPK